MNLTSEFWNANPCDGQETFFSRAAFRYRKDPWMKPLLADISKYEETILEVGCGQGTDAITVCAQKKKGRYVGLDLSEVSLESAGKALEEYAETAALAVRPDFRRGDAERLDFPDSSFDCVFSHGVLHHTENIGLAVREIHRVVKPGGHVLITLYRKSSPKVLLAYFMRFMFSLLPENKRGDCMNFLRTKKNSIFGTMLLEACAVPVLNAYNFAPPPPPPPAPPLTQKTYSAPPRRQPHPEYPGRGRPV
jgi:SAM-dependent methyltransferase